MGSHQQPIAPEKKIQQLVALKQAGSFSLSQTGYPVPAPDEICIRNRAVGLNQLDNKNFDRGMMIRPEQWPVVLGMDTAGVVEVVGAKVTGFKAGDAVVSVAGLPGRPGTQGDRNKMSAFQDVTTVPATWASRKPKGWSFAEACSVPMCYLAAAATITHGLCTPLPFLQSAGPGTPGVGTPQQQSPPVIKSVLVLGGSSGVGASAIQLLRIALPKAKIISTNSVSQNKRVMDMGADAWVDRHLEVEEIIAATRNQNDERGVDAILDAVGYAGESPKVLRVLRDDGPRMYAYVMTDKEEREVPEGVRAMRCFAGMMLNTLAPGPLGGKAVGSAASGSGAMAKLVDLVDEGKFKLPLDVQVVGQELGDIPAGLKMLKEGVSGTKLVVAL
ncbi:chaperonin 10-like protein [Echria macrotheca]|uniref:Chaperonin 10-like protein n=1 Tax=Echria macrotheca TaxID=438768 RepID=A0AAJ0BDP3_9PEZI|nr:chaperonin 10-like protein [Echria macrotheca]